MKLDRNINGTGRGKYGLINNRKLSELIGPNDKAAKAAIAFLEHFGIIEWGEPGTEGEFFVIKLRDEFAEPALFGYAKGAHNGGEVAYASEVAQLALRAGRHSPFCKKPD